MSNTSILVTCTHQQIKYPSKVICRKKIYDSLILSNYDKSEKVNECESCIQWISNKQSTNQSITIFLLFVTKMTKRMIKQEKKNREKNNGCKFISKYDQKVLDTKDKKSTSRPTNIG